MALVKEVSKETISREWKTIAMVFAQLVLIILIVVQALSVAGFHIDFYLREIAFKPSSNPIDFIVLALAAITFALLYLDVKKNQPMLYNAQQMAPSIIKETALEKISTLKYEPQAPALLFIEFLFVALLVIALRAYLDPEVELIPWSLLGLQAPVTTIVNALIAFAALAIFYKLYSITKPYRKG